jgi:hypothetical protein
MRNKARITLEELSEKTGGEQKVKDLFNLDQVREAMFMKACGGSVPAAATYLEITKFLETLRGEIRRELAKGGQLPRVAGVNRDGE